MAKNGMNEDVKKKILADAGSLNPPGSEEAKKFRLLVQAEMESRFRDKIMTALKEKKAEATAKIESSPLFDLRNLISQKSGLDKEKQEMIQQVMDSGMDKMLDFLFLLVNSKVDSLFNQVEVRINRVLFVLNAMDFADTTFKQTKEEAA